MFWWWIGTVGRLFLMVDLATLTYLGMHNPLMAACKSIACLYPAPILVLATGAAIRLAPVIVM
jgi:hypothetical protein